jgi:hypothetical protein
MKYFLQIFFLLFNFSLVFSQRHDSIKKTYEDINDLKKQIQNDKIKLFKYVDSTFKYEVNIPEWLTLRETGDAGLWGGTLPPINGIENAILIKGFYKTEFKSFNEFEQKFLTGNKFGKKTLYSDQHIWYGQNDLIEIDNGVKQKVFTLWNNQIYHNEFVLIKTPSAYLWIQFASSPDTYDINISKFEKFISELKILK